MELKITPQLRQLLQDAAANKALEPELKENALRHAQSETVPWSLLKAIRESSRPTQAATSGQEQHQDQQSVWLHQVCQGSSVVLSAPAPRKRSPELEARLQKLQEALDNKKYEEMVADVTEQERYAESMRGMLPSTRLQLSFGAHVLVTMFTFFAVAYWGSKWFWGWDELWAGLLGAIGLTAGLVIETLLLIIRTNRPVPIEERMPELFDPQAVKQAYDTVAKARAAKAAADKQRAAEFKKAARGGGGGKAGAAGQQQQAGSGADSGLRVAPVMIESKKQK